jgi:cytosine/adenosine deaminase-related metal-dependent hydrolase
MQTIKTHFPQTALSTLLKWATSEGAKVLQWDDQLGSFEKGKKPGVVLIREDLSASRRLI